MPQVWVRAKHHFEDKLLGGRVHRGKEFELPEGRAKEMQARGLIEVLKPISAPAVLKDPTAGKSGAAGGTVRQLSSPQGQVSQAPIASESAPGAKVQPPPANKEAPTPANKMTPTAPGKKASGVKFRTKPGKAAKLTREPDLTQLQDAEK